MLNHLLIITGLVLFTQFKVLTYGYVSDDIPVFKKPPRYKNRWQRTYLWLIGAYKWQPKYDHVLTMAIHILVCYGIYFAFGANEMAFIASLLFSVNPAGLHGSVWVSGRAYSLVALTLLAAMVLPILGPAFLWAGSYFTVGFTPPVALLGSKVWFLVLFMPTIWLFWFKKFKQAVYNKKSGETVDEDKKFHWKKIVLAIKTVGFYLALGIYPQKVTFYHWFLQSAAGSKKNLAYSFCKYFWIGLSAMIAWGVYACFRWDMITYGLFWYFVTIAPYSNIARVQQEISERYVYIPLIGIMVAMAAILVNFPWAFLLPLGFYWGRFHSTVIGFRDDFWVVEQACMDDPHAWFAWHIRALKRWNNHSFHEAMIFWTIANSISPKEFKLLYNLAVVFKAIKKEDQYKHFLLQAKENVIPGQEEQAKDLFNKLEGGKPVGMIY